MASGSGFLSIGARAVAATFRGLGVVLPVSILYGVLLAIADAQVFAWVGPENPLSPRQEDLIRWALTMTGVALALEFVLGPLFAACAVYVGRAYTQGATPGLYAGVNFALNRYGRMFVPHFIAQISIQLGMIIIVPGVMFLLQYAFVDAVAALEQEKSPLGRSKRLTRGRRRTLFLLILPWLVLSQVMLFVDLWALAQSGIVLAAIRTVMLLVLFVTYVGFYLIYDERTARKKAREAEGPLPAPEVQPPA